MFMYPSSMTIDIWQDLNKKLYNRLTTMAYQQEKRSKKDTSMPIKNLNLNKRENLNSGSNSASIPCDQGDEDDSSGNFYTPLTSADRGKYITLHDLLNNH